MRNSPNPVRGAAHSGQSPVTLATDQGWPALGSALAPELLPERGDREDNGSGRGQRDGHHGAHPQDAGDAHNAAARAPFTASPLLLQSPQELSRKIPALELDRSGDGEEEAGILCL